MAVTIAVKARRVAGNAREVYFDVTGPASYTTGGETLTLAQQKTLMPETCAALATVDFTKPALTFFACERDTSGRQYVLDKTNNKMMAFAAGAEATSTGNLSAVTIRCRLIYDLENTP